VIHTSEREYGQVYVPFVNSILLGAVLTLVLAFQSSAKLAFAFGLAVTGTIAVTTVLFFVVVHHRWRRPMWLATLGAALFLVLELAFFGSEPEQAAPRRVGPAPHRDDPLHGDDHLVPRIRAGRGRAQAARGLPPGLRRRSPANRSAADQGAGTGVFMSRGKETTPLSTRACVEHLHTLQEHAIVLWLESLPTPRIGAEDRLEIDDVRYKDDGITFIRARYGYAEH
jgi:KUP system potassium uptake protein